jgi:hypothetical protein
MPTNTKEYMREYQRKRRAKLKFLERPLQENVKDVKVDVKDLHPPKIILKGEIPVLGGSFEELNPETSLGEPSSKPLGIDFNKLDPGYQKWCLSLETQRHYYYTKFGKVHRKDTNAVKRDLKKRKTELDMIELLKREKVSVYRECMKELELTLQKRNEKLESIGEMRKNG